MCMQQKKTYLSRAMTQKIKLRVEKKLFYFVLKINIHLTDSMQCYFVCTHEAFRNEDNDQLRVKLSYALNTLKVINVGLQRKDTGGQLLHKYLPYYIRKSTPPREGKKVNVFSVLIGENIIKAIFCVLYVFVYSQIFYSHFFTNKKKIII